MLAVEAHPRTFECLRESVRLNRLENVEPIELAVAETSKELEIEDCDQHIGNAIRETAGGSSMIKVQAKSIDEICRNEGVESVDLLAMNIEGAEKFAVQGLITMLEKTKRLAISCHDFKADRLEDEFFRTKSEILSFVEKSGFVVVEVEFETPWDRDWLYAYNPRLVGQFA